MHNKFKALRKEAKPLLLLFIAVAVILKIAYHSESIAVVIRTSAAIYWLFVLPGYAMMLNWKEKLGFLERAALGTIAAMVIMGIASYYLGVMGLKLQNQTILLPAAVSSISLFFYLKSAAAKPF